jgi:hypothetical protein
VIAHLFHLALVGLLLTLAVGVALGVAATVRDRRGRR